MNNLDSKRNCESNQDMPIEKMKDLKPDLNMAQKFLLTLLQSDEKEEFAFQIFPEGASTVYARVLMGSLNTLKQTLTELNLDGAGIFVTINRTDGIGRKAENIIGIRALFVDLDGAPLQPVLDAPLTPHMILESSLGRYHGYWIVEGISLAEFTEIQKMLISRFNSDPVVCDLSRVMRLPGFFHNKHAPFLTKIISESCEQPFSREKFLKAFSMRDNINKSLNGVDISTHNPVLEALKHHNLIIRFLGRPQGCWAIQCPWNYLHTKNSKQDMGAKYFEPNHIDYPYGGFKCFHAHCADKSLMDLLVFLGINGTRVSCDPIPLFRPINEPQKFPFNALGNILQPAAIAMHRVIKAPDAICAQSVLGASSLACQPFANVAIDGRKIPLSLFEITVAESGDRKSSTDRAALQPIVEYQKMLGEVFSEDFKIYHQRKDIWEAKRKIWLKDPFRGVFSEEEPLRPLDPLVLVEEPTYEGIVKYLAIGQPSIGLFSDEGGRFFGGHAMNSDNLLKTMAGLSSLWDGKEISRLRGGDGNMLLYGRRLSMHMMIQEVILEQIMSNKIMEHQGFLPRCLISFPATTAGNRPYVEEDVTIHPDMRKYYNSINGLLDKKFPIGPYPSPRNELKPCNLVLTEAAKREWIVYHNAIDNDMSPGMRLDVIRRFSCKAAEHVLRIAGILAMIGDMETTLIDVDDIRRGIELVEYYISEAKRIHGYLSINPDLTLAQRVLEWCWLKGKVMVALQDIYQYGPSQIRNATRARFIMSILEKHGWATPASGVDIDGKRYKEAWVINQRRIMIG